MTKRIAVVTGGMGGIGHAICKILHDHDVHVVVSYHRNGNHDSAREWQATQKQNGYHFEIVYADVTDFNSCEAMINKVESQIGPIDILINNAGITRDVSCAKMKKDDWDIVIHTDLNSIFYVTRAVINHMTQRKYGRIINISSINGQKGQFGQVNYAAAKAGIHGFTKALAIEVARKGVTVNTISPGYVSTEMVLSLSDDIQKKILAEIPMGRFADPHEVARVVAFLSDEKSSYITGANIAINGGHYMS